MQVSVIYRSSLYKTQNPRDVELIISTCEEASDEKQHKVTSRIYILIWRGESYVVCLKHLWFTLWRTIDFAEYRRTCEEASNEKHDKVVGKEKNEPAGHKGRRESNHEPLLTNSWETKRWMELFYGWDFWNGMLRNSGIPAKSGTKAEPSMKIATPRFSWSLSRAWGWFSTEKFPPTGV